MALLIDSLIAHYKFNENTALDNDELVSGGDFATADWVGDNPNPIYWTVIGEVITDPEISEVGTGEGHGGVGTGMCNFYTSSASYISMSQTIFGLVIGRKYFASVKINKVITGSVYFKDNTYAQWTPKLYNSEGIKTFSFVATHTSFSLVMYNNNLDITIDDISIKLCAVEDSSGNDHDGCAQQQTSDLSVPGKINTAFDFNGTSDYIKVGDIESNVKSIAMWVNPDAVDVTDYLIDLNGTDGIRIVNGTVTKIGFGAGTQIIYVDSVVASTVTANWHLVILTSTTGFDANALDIGRKAAGYFNGIMDNVMLFDKVLTPLEVRYLYSSGNAGVEEVQDIIQLSRTGHSFSSRQEM